MCRMPGDIGGFGVQCLKCIGTGRDVMLFVQIDDRQSTLTLLCRSCGHKFIQPLTRDEHGQHLTTLPTSKETSV